MIQMKKPFIVELKSLSLISQEPQVELALWKEDKSENDLVQNALKKIVESAFSWSNIHICSHDEKYVLHMKAYVLQNFLLSMIQLVIMTWF